MRAFVLPKENAREIEATPDGIDVIPVSTIADVLLAYGLPLPAVPGARVQNVAR